MEKPMAGFHENLLHKESIMCSDGISQLVMTDTVINEKITASGLDFIHLQLLVNLYSLKSAHRLEHLEQDLPVYFSMSWEKLQGLLDDLEAAKLLRRTGTGLELVEEIDAPEQDHSCAC
jgi:hypothetical protein